MGSREGLSYEKRETKTLRTFTDATDIDKALEKAVYAIYDAQSFREYARATGVDVVKEEISVGMASLCFTAGAVACLLVLWCLGVI